MTYIKRTLEKSILQMSQFFPCGVSDGAAPSGQDHYLKKL